MATLKRYGLYGVMEAELLLKCGLVTLKVHFVNGRINEMGMSPAEYFSSNPLEQSMIENSSEFKSGQIKLLGIGECADSPFHPKVMRPTPRPKVEPKAEPKPVQEAPVPEAQVETVPEPVQTPEADLQGEDVAEYGEPQTEEEPSENTPTLTGEIVQVSCIQDAASFLNDRFGIPKNQLKSKAKILEAAALNGITFQGI